MLDETHKQTQHEPTPAQQQQLILRALVGSLVFCAAFASSGWAQVADRPALDERPFRELLAEARQMFESGEVSERDVFDLTFGATPAADGTLRDVNAVKVVGSPRWQQLARDLMSALSDSRVVAPLAGAEHLTLTLKLDGAGLARLVADFPTEAQAKRMADGYNAIIALARQSRAGRDGIVVLNNMTASASGKQLTMQLEMSREELGNLLRQSLALP
jgi:hypothetical protein